MKLNTIQRKKFRVTGKLKKVASSDRLRLSISRSAKNISAQIIDDVKNITLVSCSSIEKDIRSMDKVNKTEISKIVAEKLAKKAQEKKYQRYFLIEVYTNTTAELKFLLKHYVKMEWNFNYGF